MLGSPQKKQQMFITLKAMFPHIDLSVINEELTFSENLQIIVAQLGTPRQSQTRVEISNMKQAVDQQQLKIQKSLVNEEDVLGNITNRSQRRQKQQKQSTNHYGMEAIEEQSSQHWHNEENLFEGPTQSQKNGQLMGEVIFDVWELGSDNFKDWFHH